MAQVSDFLFEATSPEYSSFNFTADQSSQFQRIFLHDTIRAPYPTMELVVSDKTGEYSELLFFIENLTVDAKLGHLTRGFLAHSFFWDLAQLNDVDRAASVRGNWFYNFISDFKKQDSVKSASYKGTIDEVVTQVLAKNKTTGYKPKASIAKINGTGSKTQFIEKTLNKDTWYQDNVTDMQFIQKLATYAQAKGANSKAPFLSFFNLKGEFFFQSLQEFFTNDTTNVQTYELAAPYGSGRYFHQYGIQFLGSLTNYKNYNTTMYSIDAEGSYKSTTATLSTQGVSSKDRSQEEGGLNGRSIFPVRSDDTKSKRSTSFFGIEENQDSPAVIGKLNNQYLESHGAYRMSMTMPFNPELCAGRTINLAFKSNYEADKVYATEYSGKWLIIESNHVFNPVLPQEGTNAPTTAVELIKPSVNIWNGHKLSTSFVKIPK